MGVKCLAPEHNTMSPARTRTRTTRSGVEHTNHEAILLIDYRRKMRGYHLFSFWISITLFEICFSRNFSKPPKNTFELVGTVLNSQRFSCSGGKRFGKCFLSAFFTLFNPVLHIMIAVVHTGGYAFIQIKHRRNINLKLSVYF